MKIPDFIKSKPVIIVTIFLFSFLFANILATFPVFEALQYKVINSYFKQRGPIIPADTSIVVVAVDDETLNGMPVKWPYPGSIHAKLVYNLHKAGAKAVIFDIEFIEPNVEFPEQDVEFAMAIDSTQNVILAGKIVYELGNKGSQYSYILKPNPYLAEVAPSWGLVNSIEDEDGFLRRYLLFDKTNEQFYFPLAIEALAFLENIPLPQEIDPFEKYFRLGPYNIPKADANTMLINFAGPAETFRTYSYSSVIDDSTFDLVADEDMDIFENHLQWGTFKDKVVFVGVSANEFKDNKYTPFYDPDITHFQTPGVETHANALSTILRREYLEYMDPLLSLVFIVFFTVVAAIAILYLKATIAFAIVLAELVIIRMGAYFLFKNYGEIATLTTPYISIVFSYASGLVYRIVTEQKEKHRIRKIFQHYVSPSVVNQMVDSQKLPQFGGEKRIVTVLFSDIRSFSTYSEKYAPEVVVSRLSEYLTEMVDVIFENNGTLDKFVGDEIMALFAAPYFYKDHAEKACLTAVEMIARLRSIQKRWSINKQEYFQIGIGINTGKAIVGNLGSSQLFDYTVIGNEINLGARLEGANKAYATTILISESTYQQVKTKAVAREVDYVRVVGIKQPVRVYELRDMQPVPRIEQDLLIDTFAEGLSLYRNQRWGDALKTFRKILRYFPSDGPSRLYTVRCLDFLENPPKSGWDGVHDLKQK